MRALMENRPLFKVLKQVSRTFYLTLRILPGRIRLPMALAYLFCRVADTIADTDLIPPSERLKVLELFRGQFRPGGVDWETISEIQVKWIHFPAVSSEKLLLWHLMDLFEHLEKLLPGDQDRIRDLVLTLTRGMEMDLTVFQPGDHTRPVFLSTEGELDRYCYLVAGVVGVFWTRMLMAHFDSFRGWDPESMSSRGVRFGQGLQMTNILRDLPRDLQRGRGYLPGDLLKAHGIDPRTVSACAPSAPLRPLLAGLIRKTSTRLTEGRRYLLDIPRRDVRLRLACLWPLIFAFKTLRKIYVSDNLLDPDLRVRMTRGEIYRTMAWTLLLVFSNRLIHQSVQRLQRQLDEVLGDPPAGSVS